MHKYTISWNEISEFYANWDREMQVWNSLLRDWYRFGQIIRGLKERKLSIYGVSLWWYIWNLYTLLSFYHPFEAMPLLNKLAKWQWPRKLYSQKKDMDNLSSYMLLRGVDQEGFFCNLPLNCLIVSSTLAENPIFVSCLAFDRSLLHMLRSSLSCL